MFIKLNVVYIHYDNHIIVIDNYNIQIFFNNFGEMYKKLLIIFCQSLKSQQNFKKLIFLLWF